MCGSKRVKGNWVRLCIDAPRDVALLRIPVEKAAQFPPGGGKKAAPDETKG